MPDSRIEPAAQISPLAAMLPLPTPEEVAKRSQRLLKRIVGLDFACYEGLPLAEALPNLVAGPLHELEHALGSAGELLESMAQLTGVPALPQLHAALGSAPVGAMARATLEEGVPPRVHPDASALLEIELEQAGLLPRGLFGLGAVAQRESLGRLLTLATAQLCAATLALRSAQGEATRWGIIGACEEARRQLRHLLRIAATATLRTTEPHRVADVLAQAGPTCLGEALEARELLLSWRAETLPLAEAALGLDNDALALELRELRLKLTHLFAQPTYPLLRMADRYRLRHSERRLSAWLDQPWAQFEKARALMNELTRGVDELVQINGRLLLVQHDCRVQAEVLGLLHTLAEQRAHSGDNVQLTPPLAVEGSTAAAKARAAAAKSKPTPLHKVVTLLWQVRWRSRELEQLLTAESPQLDAHRPSAAFVQRLMDVVERALIS